MTLDDYIAVTRQAIADVGLEEYLPTLVLETRRESRIALLEGVPADGDVESAVMEWVSQLAGAKQNYFLAFRWDNQHFKVVRRTRGIRRDQIIAVEGR